MSLREKLNTNPKLAVGIMVGLVVVALVLFVLTRGQGESVLPAYRGSFFTEDNGKTFFVAPPGSIPGETQGPNGKTAYVAKVIRYGDEPPQIAWIEHYTPQGIAKLKEFFNDSANKDKPIDLANLDYERMVRRPGSERWVRSDNPDYAKIRMAPDKNGVTASYVGPE